MATLNELKKELQNKNPSELATLCLRLAKYKRENKELLDYLLNFSQNENSFIEKVKDEIFLMLVDVSLQNHNNAYKIVKKTLRFTQKNIKFSGIKQTEIELLSHFCLTLKNSNLKIKYYTPSQNLYDRQLLKIRGLIEKLHPDLQFDYENILQDL